jgi:hypothetical protein
MVAFYKTAMRIPAPKRGVFHDKLTDNFSRKILRIKLIG